MMELGIDSITCVLFYRAYVTYRPQSLPAPVVEVAMRNPKIPLFVYFVRHWHVRSDGELVKIFFEC